MLVGGGVLVSGLLSFRLVGVKCSLWLMCLCVLVCFLSMEIVCFSWLCVL